MLNLQRLYRTASLLALITIFYNIAEGVVSVWFGAEDETIALFGFGLDSLVEVISGIGYLDAVGSLFIALLSIRKGREALQMAQGLDCSCEGTCVKTG